MPEPTVERSETLVEQATHQSVSQIAGFLQETLGQRMTAYLAGIANAKQVGRWQSQSPSAPRPNQDTEYRLREGYKVVSMLVEAYDAPTAKAWLFGTNIRLEDRAPIELLREARPDNGVATSVMRAARQAAAIPR